MYRSGSGLDSVPQHSGFTSYQAGQDDAALYFVRLGLNGTPHSQPY